MSTTRPEQHDSSENIFAIDPQETLWTLARQLVAGQRTASKLADAARTLRESSSTDPAALHLLSQFDQTAHQWFSEALPNLIAGMQVAIEAHDTFGPGFTRVEDPIDAAVWNNKFFVWRERLGGTISDPSSSSDGGSAGREDDDVG